VSHIVELQPAKEILQEKLYILKRTDTTKNLRTGCNLCHFHLGCWNGTSVLLMIEKWKVQWCDGL